MSKKYDAVIIGAGVAGLTCGCYLAKAGLKILIVERHYQPGGCCTSFNRKGFIFDAGVHYLGSLREEGNLFNILKDFELLNRIKFIINDPTDRVITPDKTIFIRKEKTETRKELISHFPKEKVSINNFLSFILDNDLLQIISKTKKNSFKDLLDNFFKDYKLKAILSILLGSLGLPPSQLSALAAVVLYKEFILDGGYYPKGGMQIFPNLLTERFKEYGGEISLGTEVKKIVTHNREVIGVSLMDGEFITAKNIISSADSTATFKKLLDVESKENRSVNKLIPSPSAFIVYLGLNKKLDINPPHYVTWFFPTYNIEAAYGKGIDLSSCSKFKYLVYAFPSLVDPTLAPNKKSILRIYTGAQFTNNNITNKFKERICEKMINEASRFIPELKNNIIEVKVIATPCTFYKFTYNKKGALFGLASTIKQIDRNTFPPVTTIKNLYLTGHWVTNGAGQGGVSPSVFSGKATARLLLRNTKIKTP